MDSLIGKAKTQM